MTFLEYMIDRLDARVCPWCRRAELTTRPPHEKYKDRFDCGCCGKWGDVADIAAKCWPGADYDTRRQRLAEWRVEFERSVSITQEKGEGEYSKDIEQSFHELVDLLRQKPEHWKGSGRIMFGLRAVVWAVAIADEQGIGVEALAGRAAQHLLDRKQEAMSWRERAECENESR